MDPRELNARRTLDVEAIMDLAQANVLPLTDTAAWAAEMVFLHKALAERATKRPPAGDDLVERAGTAG